MSSSPRTRPARPASAWAYAVLLVSAVLAFGCTGVLGADGEKNKIGGDDAVQCGGESVSCGDSCAAVATDPLNCGGCGVACAAGQYCEAGACVSFCAPGEVDCAGVCTIVASDASSCGGCGLACPAGQFCDAGVCSATCAGTLCADAAGVQQCVYLDSNNDNCGACGVACADGQACQAGSCVDACPAGRLACGGGCVDVRTDAAHCGACGAACDAGVACVEGSCGGGEPVCTGAGCSCTAEQEVCNDACVNTQSNVLHCGGCGVECATGQDCVAGVCQCPAGGELCDAGCTDVLTDNLNCGTCGLDCTGGTTCQAGTCMCEAGLEICDDTCVDKQTDRNNCGDCGVVCAGYEECVEGICKYDADGCGGEARAIDITRVAMYQGVELDLFDGGSLVGPEGRNVDVIQGRDAMVRVFVAPEAGFAARELSARMFVENNDEIEVYHHKKSVAGASSQSSLDSTFQIEVPASALQGETDWRIELVECGELPTGTVGTAHVPIEAAETAELDAVETGVIKLVFVPVVHDGRTPDMSETTIAAYARDVELQYPTVGVEWSVRAAIQSNQSGTSVDLGSTLDLVTNQRDQDGVEGDVYYYGIIDPASSFGAYCSGGCTTGVGWVPDATGWWADGNRAAVGVGFGTRGVGTFSHELGHNHGRSHAPCNVSGDPNYPYPGALIGKWGYDRDAKELKDPNEHTDFMSYCNNNWVSDYSYNAYATRISILNGVSSQVQRNFSGPPTVWHRMVVTESDAPHWSSPIEGPGSPGSKSEAGLVYDASGNVIAQVDVYRVKMSHSNGYMLLVPAPQAGWHSVGSVGGVALPYP